MNRLSSVLLVLVLLSTQSCSKKDTTENKKPIISDIPFVLSSLVNLNDDCALYRPVPKANLLVLKSDYTWTFESGEIRSNGTYSWNPITLNQASVKFQVQNLSGFASDTALSNKLKYVLLHVERGEFSDAPVRFLNLYNSSKNVLLEAKVKGTSALFH